MRFSIATLAVVVIAAAALASSAPGSAAGFDATMTTVAGSDALGYADGDTRIQEARIAKAVDEYLTESQYQDAIGHSSSQARTSRHRAEKCGREHVLRRNL